LRASLLCEQGIKLLGRGDVNGSERPLADAGLQFLLGKRLDLASFAWSHLGKQDASHTCMTRFAQLGEDSTQDDLTMLAQTLAVLFCEGASIANRLLSEALRHLEPTDSVALSRLVDHYVITTSLTEGDGVYEVCRERALALEFDHARLVEPDFAAQFAELARA